MNFNGIDFDTYFKNYPDENGYFGKYGGCYINDELKNAMKGLDYKSDLDNDYSSWAAIRNKNNKNKKKKKDEDDDD